MTTKIISHIRKIQAARVRKRRFISLLLVPSICVSSGVCWQLHHIGTAMTNEYYCCAEEHQHDGTCYEDVLICTLTESDPEQHHIHSEECYEHRLICGMEEHSHTAECESDFSADLESSEMWCAALPRSDTDSISERIAEIAASQIGYSESSRNFIVAEDGMTRQGYTRYGAWYGNPYGNWNAMFASFCLYYAGVSKTEIPYGSGCWTFSVELEKNGLLQISKDILPQRGDIVFLDMDKNGITERLGIVDTVETTSENTLLTLIEGDCDDAVAENQYTWEAENVYGFLSLADCAAFAETETFTADAELTMPAQCFMGMTPSGISVQVQAEENIFYEDTVMILEDVSEEQTRFAAELAAGAEMDVLSAVAVDISFFNGNGDEIEPPADASLAVQILLPDQQQLDSSGNYRLLHMISDTSVQTITDAEITENTAEFTATSFSIYVVTALGERDKDAVHEYLDDSRITSLFSGSGWDDRVPVTDENGEIIPNSYKYVYNSTHNPYILHLNDSITLCGHAPVGATDLGYWSSQDGASQNDLLTGGGTTYGTDENGEPTATRTYTADHNNTGTGTIHFVYTIDGDSMDEILYYKVENDSTYDHADIEIADGSSFIVNEKRDMPDGSILYTTTEYVACITKVNQCNIYGTPRNTNDPFSGNIIMTYVPADYQQNGVPGSTQYELTSKYNCMGHSDKEFHAKDAYSVVFDVDVTLIPYRVSIENWNGSELVYARNEQINTDAEINETGQQHVTGKVDVPSYVFQLGHTAVVDAINKCPNHSGLDCTVNDEFKLEYCSTSLKITKELVGSKLQAGEFQFELFDENNNLISYGINDADGNVEFSNISFFDEGTYQYRVFEVTSNPEGGVIYDDTFNVVSIPVHMEESGNVKDAKYTPVVDSDRITYAYFGENYMFSNFEVASGSTPSTDNWSGRGNASVSVSSTHVASGSYAIHVTNRSAAWHGCTKSLNITDRTLLGKPYCFTADIYNPSNHAETFKLSLQYSEGGETVYKGIKIQTIPSEQYANLSGTFTIPTTAENVSLYVETDTNTSLDFYVDNIGMAPITSTGGKFVNYKFELPATGGTGTQIYLFGGSILMLCAAGLFVFRRRKEEM